ncbi:hypothetical protein ACFS07_12745 [Undibacterium arcticum]
MQDSDPAVAVGQDAGNPAADSGHDENGRPENSGFPLGHPPHNAISVGMVRAYIWVSIASSPQPLKHAQKVRFSDFVSSVNHLNIVESPLFNRYWMCLIWLKAQSNCPRILSGNQGFF